MDENPYEAPQEKQRAPDCVSPSRQFRVWDWIAVVGAPLYVGGTVVRELVTPGSAAHLGRMISFARSVAYY